LEFKKEYISLEDNVAFMRGYEACNCFGLNYKALQRGEAKHPIEKDTSYLVTKVISNDTKLMFVRFISSNYKLYKKFKSQ